MPQNAFPILATAVGILLACGTVNAGDSCAPVGSLAVKSKYLKDSFFEKARLRWASILQGSYLKGTKPCKTLTNVKGYEGFPVIECSYSSNGRSVRVENDWPPLRARVRLLQPSAKQLALWTVRACRINGQTDATMEACVDRVVDHVKSQNGAQFPVSGLVVEQHCDSSPKVKCAADAPPNAIERRPRNTPFRDGVSVDTAVMTTWTFESADTQTMNALLSERDVVKEVYRFARIAGIEREDWTNWRTFKKRPVILPPDADGSFDLPKKGWLRVSREAHKAACRSDAHELIDALVYMQAKTKM